MVLPGWQHVRLLHTNTLEGEAMSELTKEQKNEAIALFMRWVKEDSGKYRYDRNSPITFGPYFAYLPIAMRFHSDWSWLMPVVERIEKLSDLIVNKVWISINGNSCAIWTYFDVRDVLRANMSNDTFKIKQIGASKIEATFEAVYRFIVWYNKTKEQQS